MLGSSKLVITVIDTYQNCQFLINFFTLMKLLQVWPFLVVLVDYCSRYFYILDAFSVALPPVSKL